MQKKKNIRLIVILSSLVILLVILSFLDKKPDRLDVSRDLFNANNTNGISSVRLTSPKFNNQLSFESSQWKVNGKYKADPQRVTVLFSILKQVKVRKKVSRLQQSRVDSLLNYDGVKAEFYTGEQLQQKFQVAGDEERGITYFSDGSETYIVQIPGYNVYIANIFKLDENGWRDPLVISMDWINLNSVEMIYPENVDEAFQVNFVDRRFIIDGIDQPDSTKVTDFLDDVSRLYVNDYLFDGEQTSYSDYLDRTQATVVVSDVGRNSYTIEFFEKIDGNQIIARIDSSQYALIDYGKVKKVLRPKSFFKPKRADQ